MPPASASTHAYAFGAMVRSPQLGRNVLIGLESNGREIRGIGRNVPFWPEYAIQSHRAERGQNERLSRFKRPLGLNGADRGLSLHACR